MKAVIIYVHLSLGTMTIKRSLESYTIFTTNGMSFVAIYLAGIVLTITITMQTHALTQDVTIWQTNRKDFRIISAAPLYGNNNIWRLLARRIPDTNGEAGIVGGNVAKVNAKIPLFIRRLNQLFYATQASIRQMYNDGVRNLEEIL